MTARRPLTSMRTINDGGVIQGPWHAAWHRRINWGVVGAMLFGAFWGFVFGVAVGVSW